MVCAGLLGAVWAEDAYIQSDGTQHIRTGYCANPRTKVVCDFAYVDATTVQQRIFGADDDGTTAGISFSSYINGDGLYAWAFQDGVGNWTSTGVKADTTRRTLTIDGPGSKVTLATGSTVNYTATISTARTKTSIWPLAIFGSNRSTGYTSLINPAKAKLYSFAIYEDGAPIHYYKPYRSADGATVGLKDLITGTILTQGAGNAFVGGGDISDNPVLDLPGVGWMARASWSSACAWACGIAPERRWTVPMSLATCGSSRGRRMRSRMWPRRAPRSSSGRVTSPPSPRERRPTPP